MSRGIETGTVLVLVRHGETTEHGRPRINGGASNPALSENGLVQASALADKLAHVPLAGVIASPLDRAVQTARPHAESRGLTVVTNPLLIERFFGAKIEMDQPDEAHKANRRRVKEQLWQLPPAERLDVRVEPDMEPDSSVLARFREFAFNLGETAPVEPVEIPTDTPVVVGSEAHLAVSHSDVVGAALVHETGRRYLPDYASFAVFDIDTHNERIRLLGVSGMELKKDFNARS